MGSMSSRPNVPSMPTSQVVYVPTTPTTPTPTSHSDDEGKKTASEVRSENLLRRNRGTFGTVTTSLRGLVGLSTPSSERKTLLGE
ncbi:MAG: hypothetical protein KTR28_07340 [Micavibrio sp.]|nr:hypothetical protein [Micavibrio sp.]